MIPAVRGGSLKHGTPEPGETHRRAAIPVLAAPAGGEFCAPNPMHATTGNGYVCSNAGLRDERDLGGVYPGSRGYARAETAPLSARPRAGRLPSTGNTSLRRPRARALRPWSRFAPTSASPVVRTHRNQPDAPRAPAGTRDTPVRDTAGGVHVSWRPRKVRCSGLRGTACSSTTRPSRPRHHVRTLSKTENPAACKRPCRSPRLYLMSEKSLLGCEDVSR